MIAGREGMMCMGVGAAAGAATSVATALTNAPLAIGTGDTHHLGNRQRREPSQNPCEGKRSK